MFIYLFDWEVVVAVVIEIICLSQALLEANGDVGRAVKALFNAGSKAGANVRELDLQKVIFIYLFLFFVILINKIFEQLFKYFV